MGKWAVWRNGKNSGKVGEFGGKVGSWKKLVECLDMDPENVCRCFYNCFCYFYIQKKLLAQIKIKIHSELVIDGMYKCRDCDF